MRTLKTTTAICLAISLSASGPVAAQSGQGQARQLARDTGLPMCDDAGVPCVTEDGALRIDAPGAANGLDACVEDGDAMRPCVTSEGFVEVEPQSELAMPFLEGAPAEEETAEAEEEIEEAPAEETVEVEEEPAEEMEAEAEAEVEVEEETVEVETEAEAEAEAETAEVEEMEEAPAEETAEVEEQPEEIEMDSAEAETDAETDELADALAEAEAEEAEEAMETAEEDSEVEAEGAKTLEAGEGEIEDTGAKTVEVEETEETTEEVAQTEEEVDVPEVEEASAAAAAAADTDGETEASADVTVETEEVTEETSRSATEDFDTAVNATAEARAGSGGGGGLSNFEKALIVGLGAVAVGSILNNGDEVVSNSGDRVILKDSRGNLRVLKDDDVLLRQPGAEVRTEQFSDGSTRTIVTREDGTRIITIRAADGRVVKRSRRFADGTEVVLFDDTETVEPVRISELPKVKRTTIEVDTQDEDALRDALARAEIADLDRRFSLRQVRQIRAVRDLAPEIELDAITFASGSAAIQASQAEELAALGRAMQRIIDDRPGEVFLIEGHTDAVGAADYNLALSDRRAETVALALTEYFDVPPENMITQGYGESELKIQTSGDERRNRRATVRRITPLLQVASN